MVAKHSNLIFDVGMHEGQDTDFYLKKGFNVVAFEANPELLRLGKARFRDAIHRGRLLLVEGAIVDETLLSSGKSSVPFYVNHDISAWGTIDRSWAQRNEASGTKSKLIEVPIVDFASCVERFGIPRYLKVDIEGADLVCLKALLRFTCKPDYVSIESEKVVFDRLVQEMDLLTELGYDKFKAIQQGDVTKQHPPSPPLEGDGVSYKFEAGASGLFGEETPGVWKSKAGILFEYKRIFSLYKLVGDASPARRNAIGRLLIKVASKMLGRPIPGWYDTHARHSSFLLPYRPP